MGLDFTPPLLLLGEGEVTRGEPVRVTATNHSIGPVLAMEVRLEGEGSRYVQLAVDRGGEPGVWAEASQGIRPLAGPLEPLESVAFWARAVYDSVTVNQQFAFDVVVTTRGME